jgi:hypothetical protein
MPLHSAIERSIELVIRITTKISGLFIPLGQFTPLNPFLFKALPWLKAQRKTEQILNVGVKAYTLVAVSLRKLGF